jgi:hypothetical protein
MSPLDNAQHHAHGSGMKMIKVLLLLSLAACADSPAATDGGADTCPPCDDGKVCVENGHYRNDGNAWTWITTAPPSCERACDQPDSTCPAGMTNAFDRQSVCYCVAK